MNVETMLDRLASWTGPNQYTGPRPQLSLVTTEVESNGSVPVLAVYRLDCGSPRPLACTRFIGTAHHSDVAELRKRVAWLLQSQYTP